MSSFEWPPQGLNSTTAVTSLNSLVGAITLSAGTGISITPSGNTLTIANTSPLSFPLLAPNGSAAAPSYSFSSSASTGIYSQGTNELALATDGVNGLTLDSNQNFVLGSQNTVNHSIIAADSGVYGSSVYLQVNTNGGGADSAGTFGLNRSVNNGTLSLGGGAGNSGARLLLYGPSHATLPSVVRILNGFNEVRFDANANVRIETVGSGLAVAEGSNAKQGVATLSLGTIIVSNSSVSASSRIFLTAQDNNSTGSLRVSARSAGTSFTITSSNSGDSGVVAYEIFEPS